MFALRDFRYLDKETGGIVQVKAGDPVSEKVLNMHQDPAKLIRTRYIAGDEVAAAAARAAVVPPIKRKRGRPRKNS